MSQGKSLCSIRLSDLTSNKIKLPISSHFWPTKMSILHNPVYISKHLLLPLPLWFSKVGAAVHWKRTGSQKGLSGFYSAFIGRKNTQKDIRGSVYYYFGYFWRKGRESPLKKITNIFFHQIFSLSRKVHLRNNEDNVQTLIDDVNSLSYQRLEYNLQDQ